MKYRFSGCTREGTLLAGRPGWLQYWDRMWNMQAHGIVSSPKYYELVFTEEEMALLFSRSEANLWDTNTGGPPTLELELSCNTCYGISCKNHAINTLHYCNYLC